MSNDFTPQEQVLIERLENAPQRRLSAEAKEAILQQMLAQVGAPPKEQRLSFLSGVSPYLR